MDIEAVSFDMDGTLITKDFADHFWLKKIPELYSEKEGIGKEEAFSQIFKEYERIGKDDMRWYEPDYWFSELGLERDPREVIEEVRKDYELYGDAAKAINELKKDHRLVVTSNGHEMFLEAVLNDYREHFTAFYSAVSDFKSARKTREVYKMVCDDLGVEPKRVVHVGDSLENDYEPAIEAGLQAYLLDRDGSKEVKSGIRKVDDLLHLLDGLE